MFTIELTLLRKELNLLIKRKNENTWLNKFYYEIINVQICRIKYTLKKRESIFL